MQVKSSVFSDDRFVNLVIGLNVKRANTVIDEVATVDRFRPISLGKHELAFGL